MAEIMLDPDIRNWVVLPLVCVMILVGIVRHYALQLMKSEQETNIQQLKQMQTLQRAQRTRGSSHFILPSAFGMRKQYFTDKEKGVLRTKKGAGGPVNPMMNPNGMVDMMKNNMAFMLPNMAMMGLISYFFSGFVVVRVPFPLTVRFKIMMQRGIDLSTLDPSYVSSLSWYFLVMFGLRGLFTLILGDNTMADEARMMQAQMGMAGGPGMGFDASKAYQQERDSLNLIQHKWCIEDVEKTLLGKKYPKKSKLSSSSRITRPGQKN